MTVLTEVGSLATPSGAPCQLNVIRGFLRRGTRLELFSIHGWKPLVQARVVIDGAPANSTCYLTTMDRNVYTARPDDLIRVRSPRPRKAGETPS